jgi:hypothetical protein
MGKNQDPGQTSRIRNTARTNCPPSSIADPDPGSGAFLNPNPGAGIVFFPVFLGKKFYYSL